MSFLVQLIQRRLLATVNVTSPSRGAIKQTRVASTRFTRKSDKLNNRQKNLSKNKLAVPSKEGQLVRSLTQFSKRYEEMPQKRSRKAWAAGKISDHPNEMLANDDPSVPGLTSHFEWSGYTGIHSITASYAPFETMRPLLPVDYQDQGHNKQLLSRKRVKRQMDAAARNQKFRQGIAMGGRVGKVKAPIYDS